MAYEADKTIGELEDLTLATGDLLVFGDVTDSNRAKKITIDALDTYLSATTKTLTNKTVTAVAISLPSETASTIASLDASKNIKSLATGTYPSLAELAYVKGVTSAIQTQITARALKGANTDITSLGGLTTPLSVAQGGTGIATTTAYAVLCGGTTATGAFQSIASLGTSGHVLTSNGAGALPSFQSSSIPVYATNGTTTQYTSATEVSAGATISKTFQVLIPGLVTIEWASKVSINDGTDGWTIALGQFNSNSPTITGVPSLTTDYQTLSIQKYLVPGFYTLTVTNDNGRTVYIKDLVLKFAVTIVNGTYAV